MTPITFIFNRAKAIEAILYIASRIHDPSFHSISKILYFADKTSLEQYGRFISGDTYYAMEYGPVPSETYNLMKAAAVREVPEFHVSDGKKVIPLREPNLSELSESDVEALDTIITLYGHVPFWKRTEDSHDAAWQDAWARRGDSQRQIMPVESILKLLEDGEDLLVHFQEQHE